MHVHSQTGLYADYDELVAGYTLLQEPIEFLIKDVGNMVLGTSAQTLTFILHYHMYVCARECMFVLNKLVKIPTSHSRMHMSAMKERERLACRLTCTEAWQGDSPPAFCGEPCSVRSVMVRFVKVNNNNFFLSFMAATCLCKCKPITRVYNRIYFLRLCPIFLGQPFTLTQQPR